LLMLLQPGQAWAQDLQTGLEEALSMIDLAPLEQLENGRDWKQLILSMARGETLLSPEGVIGMLWRSFLGTLTQSMKRMGAVTVPAMVMGAVETLQGNRLRDSSGTACHYACFLAAAALMAQDLGTYIALCRESMGRMSQTMQSLFPLLLTLLAAVGGKAGAAFFQPAVVAAGGFMTSLITHVTLPLTTASAMTTLMSHLSRRGSVTRLGKLLQKAASWTLGVSFTVFIGVTVIQGLGSAAVDGISIRTAKYAIDNFVPFVGGMFADTVDTLVGCSLLIKNALGVTGLAILLGVLMGPMLKTLGAALMYQTCAAVLQPVAESRLLKCMADFSKVLMLLFAVQLSLGAMFFLLIALILAAGNLTVMLR